MIESIVDLQNLVRSGETDWEKYGEVNVIEKDGLLLFNYTNAAQYAARWNAYEQMCRGLILNRETGEVVARAFDRMFNWLEGGRVSRGHIVTVTEKVDGSLGILYRVGNEFRIATRGSFDGAQATWATEFLRKNYDLRDLPPEYTLIFEIIY